LLSVPYDTGLYLQQRPGGRGEVPVVLSVPYDTGLYLQRQEVFPASETMRLSVPYDTGLYLQRSRERQAPPERSDTFSPLRHGSLPATPPPAL